MRRTRLSGSGGGRAAYRKPERAIQNTAKPEFSPQAADPTDRRPVIFAQIGKVDKKFSGGGNSIDFVLVNERRMCYNISA